MDEINKEFGKHYIVEFIGCNDTRLKFVKDIEAAMLKAAQVSKATVIESRFHQFAPQGVSGFILIKESHFSIHTWPEDNYAAFDILTCGEMYPEKAVDFLKEYFQAKKSEVRIFQRGF